MAWHYIEDGKIAGPLSAEEFKAKQADLDPSTLVWRDGMKDWQRLEGLSLEPAKAFPKPRGHFTHGRRVKLAPVPPPQPQQRASSYGGFWMRAGALLIDKAIFFFAFSHFFSSADSGSGWFWNWRFDSGMDWQQLIAPFFSGLAWTLLALAYETAMVAEFEATLGKMVFGLRVQHEGERLSYGRSLGRALGKKLSGYILCIGYLMVVWDPQKRALHDHICASRVLKT